MRVPVILSCLFALLGQPLNAEIYRYTDENGRTVFSDKAPKNSETVTLPTLNTTPAVDVAEPQRSKVNDVNMDRNTIQISSPSDGTIIPNGLVATTVSVRTGTPLQDGQQIRIKLDGSTITTSSATSHEIPRLTRGQHQIRAILISKDGKNLAEDSSSVMVYLPTN
ncbi:DUF4124 domain-containing protein [uncultured Zhongshania sp.]|uniref:DUF4124 domain-containing protein n=1 Tax=uncultured Zhongshania sp. TaxID=1642288 RepID=UPI0030DDA30A|tara:strand:+ start:34 stop:531 length:498 start_codon:yes stop_codon:yes gene_type:complete